MYSQIIVLLIILLTLILFIIGKLRYDFVAILAVLLLVIFKIISPEEAFKGFSHPAVITVASVLVLSSTLVKTGAIDSLVVLVNKGSNKITIKLLILMGITAFLSAFMNNIGALALIVPIALKISKTKKIPASKLLMPIAFASLLGGMMTSIGTPPNLIISQFRMEAGKDAFSFFALAPVGISVATVGILFVSLIGWRFIPKREAGVNDERFNLDDFLFELVVNDERLQKKGVKLKEFYDMYGVGINVVSILRGDRQIVSPNARRVILKDDILLIKCSSEHLNEVLQKTNFYLKGAKTDKLITSGMLKSDEISLIEVVLRNDSPLIGKTAVQTKLRNRYNANLIAVSRRGVTAIDRLKTFKFNSGDILLLQVPKATLSDLYNKMRCIPLTEDEVDLKIKRDSRPKILTITIFLISILLTAFNVLPVYISFLSATLLLVIFKVISPKEVYESIEWPTILMIGSLFALGHALEVSGGSQTIANLIVNLANHIPKYFIVIILMLITIILTNIINNNAATILVAPIAVSIALALNISIDPLLIAIAIGASISFLTPISHQSNMLVMGPGGYKFTDYWKLGLPLTLISIIVGVPLILLFFPF